MAYPVEARYVPKSLTYRVDTDGVSINIKAPSVRSTLQSLFLIIFAFIIPPMLLIASFPLAALAFVGMLGGGIYLSFAGSPPMRISAAGVEVQGKLYRAADAAHFTDHIDDSWLAQFIKITKLEPLGLQYGIYSVQMPYVLSSVELAKVVVFLTALLKAQSPELNAERERKIQQAQSF